MSRDQIRSFRESGVDWIGPVPSHWRVLPIKRVFNLQSGDTINSEAISEAGEYAVYGANGFRGYTETYNCDGAFVLIGRQGALCGNINYASGKFFASEHAIAVLPKEDCELTWTGELFRSMDLGQYSVSAAQPGLSVDVLRRLKIPVPSSEEQRAISGELSLRLAEIDALISEKEKFTKLLHEKQSSIISTAVTKGLDPTRSLRDSGIDWVGAVPAHWEKLRLKRVLRSVDYGISSPLEAETGVAVLRMNNLDRGEIDFTSLKYVNEVSSDLLLKAGDLLFNRTNSLELVGQVGLVRSLPEVPLSFASYLVRLRTTARVSPEFLNYLLNHPGLLKLVRRMAFAAIGQANLNPTRYSEINVCIPEVEEQEEIVAHINKEVKHLQELLSASERMVTLLRVRVESVRQRASLRSRSMTAAA